MDLARYRNRLLMGGVVAGALVAGTAAGATIVTPILASAAGTPATITTPAPSGGSGGGPPGGQAPARMPAHGTAAHENAETPVTGADAAKAQAAAVKAVGSGTAGAVTTDYTKQGYEVTVTKPDGSKVEVHLDSSFNVMQGPGGPGGPGRPDDNDADDSGSGSGA